MSIILFFKDKKYNISVIPENISRYQEKYYFHI